LRLLEAQPPGRHRRLGAALAGLAVAAALVPVPAFASNCSSLSDCWDSVAAAVLVAVALAALLAIGIAVLPALAVEAVEIAEVAEVAEGTGAFLEGAAGGEGLGTLEGVSMEVTQDGLAQVEGHLAQFGEYGPNEAMLERLGTALSEGQPISGADAAFYTHELTESSLMQQGMSYEAAHAAALEQYGISPYAVYAREVVAQFPELFNDAWRAFWGLL
jgi:hypothetical protein